MLHKGQQFISAEGRRVKVEETINATYKGSDLARYRLSGETRYLTEDQVRQEFDEVRQVQPQATTAQGR